MFPDSQFFDFEGWALLVHLAAITQVIGYLIRDQIRLRILLLMGTLLYIAYYRLYPETPLWDAIFWGAMLASANLLTIVALVRDRLRFRMRPEEERLFRAFSRISPGEFRRLMRIARFHTAGPDEVLTREGEVPDRLFFVTSGSIEIRKGDRAFTYMAGCFIGELALISGEPASATVRLPEGSEYVCWQRAPLQRLMQRRPATRMAVDALISTDMAHKLRAS